MTRWIEALAVIMLIAGCVSPATIPDQDAGEASDRPPLRFLPAREIATYDNMEVESFIESSPDGQTLLTCLHGEFTRPSYMFASEDGGDSFRELTAFPSPGAGGDCFVAMSPEGAWSFVHSIGFGTTVATTLDKGRSWIVNPAAAHPTNGFADRPWLSYDGESLLLAYMPLIWQPGGIGFTRSDDYGASWTVSETIVDMDPELPYVRHGNFLHGPDGTIRIPYVRSASANAGESEGPMKLAFAVSRDGGHTWVQERVAEITAAAATATGTAQGGDGTLYWPYYVSDNGSHELRVLTSIDSGATWDHRPVVAGLSQARLWWGDGRPDGSADFTLVVDGALVDAEGLHVAVARVSLADVGLVVEITPARDYPDGLEYVGIDHDAAGRAFAVIPDPGFRVTTTGYLYLAAEEVPR